MNMIIGSTRLRSGVESQGQAAHTSPGTGHTDRCDVIPPTGKTRIDGSREAIRWKAKVRPGNILHELLAIRLASMPRLLSCVVSVSLYSTGKCLLLTFSEKGTKACKIQTAADTARSWAVQVNGLYAELVTHPRAQQLGETELVGHVVQMDVQVGRHVLEQFCSVWR
ncbi:hypothetical protein RRG08_045591 [Elysia crispata]|uniref:Uncharacterized protein n=1 Tax=Elysia crispata TaxID=231223 RepID=A0AAE1DXP3_9GAST|nr:hypothetical protein RRG08_045591 [Elysia crispata]